MSNGIFITQRLFKDSKLYANPFQYFGLHEYLLAPHVIIPYKEPEARKQDKCTIQLMSPQPLPRVKIGHVLAVLKSQVFFSSRYPN